MGQPQRTNRIIVGLDRAGSHNELVLTAALEQARLARAALSVVHAIAPAPADRLDVRDRHAARRADHRAATDDLHRHLSRFATGPDAPAVEYDVRHGDPATVLLAAARHAGLIVIGTRRAGAGSPFLLGSVSQDVAVHATCPVLLIPQL
jgi:nucleotide-binding universal stress UspA family protein